MYFRKSDRVLFFREKKEILLGKYESCAFDTYFNGFMLEAWSDKAKIDSLILSLIGQGKFRLRVCLNRFSIASRILLEKNVNLSQNGILIDISSALRWKDGMVFFDIVSLEENAIFQGGSYVTKTSPVNDVKLGLIITHFNRKQYVLPAIDRVNSEIANSSVYKDKIKLIVVDNSSNITEEEACGASVIANKNLGGSGGFARGLLHLMDDKTFTHCLFMDDDASCEIEAILRSYHLLQYVSEEKFAISGALLREDAPSILHEKGAKFSNAVHDGLKRGMNVIHQYDVIASQLIDKNANYGAWWFFAFKISDVEFYPFPFFVRGDDILFGILNKFNVFTLNGIACWGEDFWVKENPLTRYLGLRGTLVCSMLVDNLSRLDMLKVYAKLFIPSLFSYNYGSAEAILISAEDVMEKGPELFVGDMSATSVREKLSNFVNQEKMSPLRREKIQPEFVIINEGRWRKIFRFLTLNGFLLPHFLIKDSTVFQHKHFRASFREIFRYKKIYYEYEADHVGYVATHDKKRFFSLLWRFTKSLVVYGLKYKKVRQEYRDRMPEMTSLEFWRKVYDDDKNVVVQKLFESEA